MQMGGMSGGGSSMKTSTVMENGKRVTRTEKTTVDRNGKKVTEVTEQTDDGRGNVLQNTYMLEDGAKKKPSKAIKRQ